MALTCCTILDWTAASLLPDVFPHPEYPGDPAGGPQAGLRLDRRVVRHEPPGEAGRGGRDVDGDALW